MWDATRPLFVMYTQGRNQRNDGDQLNMILKISGEGQIARLPNPWLRAWMYVNDLPNCSTF